MSMQSWQTDDYIDEVIEQYSPMIYRIAINYTKSKNDAEDVCQEVFLRYIRKDMIFENEEHRKAWLIRATINCAKSFFSSAWNRKTITLDENIDNTNVYIFELPEENNLHDALLTLPSKYRMVLHLFYFEEMSVEEISAVINVKQPAIRMQLTRGRKILKNSLKGDFDEQ